MKIDEALETLETFAYMGLKEWESYEALHGDIQATAILVHEFKQLRKRIEKQDAEIAALRDIALMKGVLD